MSNITNGTAAAAASPPASPFVTTPSPAAIILPILSFSTIVLDTPCLLWHVSNRNAPAGMLVGWVVLQNIIVFINALIWPMDDVEAWWHGEGYCDVVAKLDFAGAAAIGACALCVMRALAAALDTHRPVIMTSSSERLRHRVFVCALCVGLPVYSVVVAYVVQSARYYISGISGCGMAQYNSLLMIFLCYAPLMLLMLATCFYAVVTVVRLRRYRRELATVLASTESGLSKTRFYRLLCLSVVLIIIYTPLLAYTIYLDVDVKLFPFEWSLVHDPAQSGRIILTPAYGVPRLDSWIRVTIGFVVFACFGFGKDIKHVYRRCLERLGLARFFPYLWLGDGDPRSAGARAAAAARQKRRLNISSLTSSSPSLKSRAKLIFSNFSSLSTSASSSRGSSMGLNSLSGTGAGTRASSGNNAPSHHLVSSPSTPCTSASFPPSSPLNIQSRRPMGLLEQDLYDIGDSSSATDSKVATSTAKAMELSKDSLEIGFAAPATCTNSVSSRSTVPLVVKAPEPSYQPVPATQMRSRFWQRLSIYVHGMGPRPALNLGVERAQSPSRNTSAKNTNKPGHDTSKAQPGEYQQMKDRDYEAYVLGRLA